MGTRATPILALPFPAENDNPFHTNFNTAIDATDAYLAAALEDASCMLAEGGTFALVGSTLSWSSDIKIFAGRSNAVITIAAGSITLADGHVAWLNGLSRPIVTATLGSISSGASGPGWDVTKMPLFRRVGTNVYMLRSGYGLDRVIVEL